jgi:hypothetical protein
MLTKSVAPGETSDDMMSRNRHLLTGEELVGRRARWPPPSTYSKTLDAAGRTANSDGVVSMRVETVKEE